MSKNKQNGPGRPAYVPNFPRTDEWTFEDWCNANEVQTSRKSKRYGKGPKCTMLTLRKYLDRDMNVRDEKGEFVRRNSRSTIVMVKGVTADPNSAKGLGRRSLVYALREKAPKSIAKDISTSDTPTSDALEQTKADLLAPTPAVTISPQPVAEPVIVTPQVTETVAVTAPATETVAETVAPETVTAQS